MSQPIILPSILLPRRHADLISRPRLQEKLLNLLEYKLILITAPAGYGKTALLVDFAHRVEMPACWYTINQHDQEFQCFLAHFTSALLRVFPGFAQQARQYTDLQSATCPGPEEAAIVIINELHQRVAEHFTFTLDDFHLVCDHPQIARFVSHFAQHVSDHCHLFIATRRQPDLPDLALMAARSQVGGLALESLLFTAPEVQLLVLSKYGVHLSDRAAEELARQTEGWITALLLADATAWQGKIDIHRADRATGISLACYWDHFLLSMPAPVRNYLLHTSLFDEFDSNLCAAVLGGIAYPPETNWHSLIQIILHENLFVMAIGEDGDWLRYHALFQEYLQNRLEQSNPKMKARLLRRLAEVYEQQQEWEKAHDACLRLGDLQATLDLVERAGPHLVRHARYETLNRWLEPIPASILDERPCLLSLQGTLATLGDDAPKGLELLDRAAAALRTTGSTACLVRTLLRRSSAHHFLGNHFLALADAEEAYHLVENDPGLLTMKAEALRARGTSLGSVGRLDQAIDCLQQALALSQSLDDAPNLATLQKELGIACRKAGRLEAAHTAYQAALGYWRQAGSPHRLTDLLNNLGVMHHCAGAYEPACLVLNEALQLARQCHYTRLEAFTLASLGDVYAELDAGKPALQAYEQAGQVARRIRHRSLPLHLDLARANLARTSGDLEQAHSLLDAARQRLHDYSDFDRGQWLLASGCLALAAGDTGQAIRHLQEASQFFDVSHLPIEMSRARLHLSNAHYQAGDMKSALAQLGLAFQEVEQTDSPHTLMVQSRECRPLLEFACQSTGCAAPTQRLLGQMECFERQLPALRRRLRRLNLAIPLTPPALFIRALGEAEIEINGQLLTTADWKSQVQREVFFYLVAHPEGVSRRTLERTFWTDDSSLREKSRRQCENAIARLRETFGEQTVIFERDRYHFNRALDYEYDVETFLEILERARAEADLRKRADAFRAAAALYRGAYLDDASGSWKMPIQMHLWQACLEALLHLADFHLEQKQYPAVLDYCWRVLEKEPHQEAAHRALLRAYAAMGDRAGLVRQYQRCQDALAEYGQTTPSPETRKLYRALTRD